MKYSNYNYFDFELEDLDNFDFELENLENYLSESLLMVQKNITRI